MALFICYDGLLVKLKDNIYYHYLKHMLSAFSKIMKSYNKMLQETFRTGSILGFYQRLTQHNWILCSWQLPCDYNRGDIVFPVLPTSFTALPALNIPAENAGVMGESKAHASGFGIALEEILGGETNLDGNLLCIFPQQKENVSSKTLCKKWKNKK